MYVCMYDWLSSTIHNKSNSSDRVTKGIKDHCACGMVCVCMHMLVTWCMVVQHVLDNGMIYHICWSISRTLDSILGSIL